LPVRVKTARLGNRFIQADKDFAVQESRTGVPLVPGAMNQPLSLALSPLPRRGERGCASVAGVGRKGGTPRRRAARAGQVRRQPCIFGVVEGNDIRGAFVPQVGLVKVPVNENVIFMTALAAWLWGA
jgi:hypothetical protein